VHHVEDVARMLTIHRRDKLAAVELCRRQDRNGEVRGGQVLGAVDQRVMFDWKRSATKHHVHLDLDLRRTVADHELDVIALCGGVQVGAVSLARERCLNRSQFHRDVVQGGLTVRAMVDKHKVYVDRQTWHLLHEQIQRGPAFHREPA
jgi:hypothetical protein